MITITGPYHTSSGALVNGFVRFRPYPYSDNKGTGKVISTTLVDGREKTVEFEDGEPVDTLTLYQGTYEVVAPLTKTQRIAVPGGTATMAIAELITTGITNPPTAGAGMPSGGTTGQVIVKSSATDYDVAWDDSPAGTPASTVVEETDFGQASAVGTATAYARADHTHGTPATPSAADVGADPAGTAAAAVSDHAGGTGVHSIAGVTGLQTALDALMALAIHVTALPASPVRGQPYELTQADATANAPPGVFIHDGTGWFCLVYSAPYNLGDLTGALSLSLIAGAAYVGATTGNITTYAVSLSRTGIVTIRRSNASGYTVVQPSSAGRTQKLLSATGWDDAAGNGVLDVIEDDGVNIIAATSLLA